MRQSRARVRAGRPLMWGDPPVDAGGVEQASFHLPVGTATFMLTDVEDARRLRDSAPEVMAAAIVRYDEVLDEAISRHGGVRRPQQDDGLSVVAAFTRASDAVAAALDVQQSCHRERWPGGASLRLRIAVHTAEPSGARRAVISARESADALGCARLRTAVRLCCPGLPATWSLIGFPNMPS
jgi:class 3 adenylate cyclase